MSLQVVVDEASITVVIPQTSVPTDREIIEAR